MWLVECRGMPVDWELGGGNMRDPAKRRGSVVCV